MKRIYRIHRNLHLVNDNTVVPLEDDWWRYLDEDDTLGERTTKFSTWEDFEKMVKWNLYESLSVGRHLFGIHRVIYQFYCRSGVISERTFKGADVSVSFNEVSSPTIKKLMEKLPADDFAEWIKDKGLALSLK